MHASAAERRRSRRWGAVLVVGSALTLLAGSVAWRPSSGLPIASSALPIVRHPSGAFVHPAAGMEMPEAVGPFRRTEVAQFDAEGRDVSAGYSAVVGEPPLPIVATLYVYPRRADQELDAYFEGLIDDIGSYHGGAEPEFRKPIRLGGGFAGRYAIFGYAEPWGGLKQAVPLRSYLVLYAWNGWWVKWRATTPAPIDDERMQAIVDLTETVLPPDVGTDGVGPVAEAAYPRTGSH